MTEINLNLSRRTLTKNKKWFEISALHRTSFSSKFFSTSEKITDGNKCRPFLVLVSAEHCVVFTETAAKSRDNTTSLFFIMIFIYYN